MRASGYMNANDCAVKFSCFFPHKISHEYWSRIISETDKTILSIKIRNTHLVYYYYH